MTRETVLPSVEEFLETHSKYDEETGQFIVHFVKAMTEYAEQVRNETLRIASESVKVTHGDTAEFPEIDHDSILNLTNDPRLQIK